MPLPPPRPAPEQRRAEGKDRRAHVARSAHAAWLPAANRPDPIALLEESSSARIPELVPLRYGRMLVSPFTFLRGAPIVMAHDLAATPTSGFITQLCGDAHLRNFGVYASPERRLLFDLNDFDETFPGPWEWDVKRLATSVHVAGRCNGFSESQCTEAVQACARSYRERLNEFSELPLLDVWFSRVDADAALEVFRGSGKRDVAKSLDKARTRNSLQALGKLAEVVEGRHRIRDNPPVVEHVQAANLEQMVHEFFSRYLVTLQEDRRTLLLRYRFVDFARKVVGVGSVGTRCFIVLFDAGHIADPLFLQIKEAGASVLERSLGVGTHPHHGHRVVTGQRLMQSASDIFLGWARVDERDYYVRTLRDMKGAAEVERMTPRELADYAGLCGWVLARAHARAGDPAPVAGYLGKSDSFDLALASFARSYADQTERDFEALQHAVQSGRLPVLEGV